MKVKLHKNSLPCVNGSCAKKFGASNLLRKYCDGTRMRGGGIVWHMIFAFYNPSPASRELPLHKGALFCHIAFHATASLSF